MFYFLYFYLFCNVCFCNSGYEFYLYISKVKTNFIPNLKKITLVKRYNLDDRMIYLKSKDRGSSILENLVAKQKILLETKFPPKVLEGNSVL